MRGWEYPTLTDQVDAQIFQPHTGPILEEIRHGVDSPALIVGVHPAMTAAGFEGQQGTSHDITVAATAWAKETARGIT